MAKKTQIGELDLRIEFIKYDYSQAEDGGADHNENPIGFRWSKKMDLSGDEEIEGSIVAVNMCKYIVHYEEEILTNGVTYYIKDNTGEYNIHSVAQLGRKEYLMLKASRRD